MRGKALEKDGPESAVGMTDAYGDAVAEAVASVGVGVTLAAMEADAVGIAGAGGDVTQPRSRKPTSSKMKKRAIIRPIQRTYLKRGHLGNQNPIPQQM